MNTETLRFKRLHPNAILPAQALQGAGYDLASVEGGLVWTDDAMDFETGLAVEIPLGYVGLVFSRSGHGFKHDVSLANSVGVIDHAYTGSVKVRLRNGGTEPFQVDAGDKICQLVVVPCLNLPAEWVDELPESERGDGGFGSTGK